jgi:hypothetical protein
MPSKFISNDWRVVVNNVDLSDHAFDVAIADEKDRVDVSGFGGVREFLPGLQSAGVTVQFLGDFGTASVHQTLEPLYTGGSIFPFYVQPDNDGGTASTTNPKYGGSASIFSYPMGATLNERAEQTVEFLPAPNSQFAWGTAAIGTV